MKKQKGHLIKSVDPGSIAEELELEPGDRLLTINGNEVEDIFDYEYYVDSESMVMLVEKADGEQWELEIESGGEDLGLTFENGLMSDYRSCSNNIFAVPESILDASAVFVTSGIRVCFFISLKTPALLLRKPRIRA